MMGLPTVRLVSFFRCSLPSNGKRMNRSTYAMEHFWKISGMSGDRRTSPGASGKVSNASTVAYSLGFTSELFLQRMLLLAYACTLAPLFPKKTHFSSPPLPFLYTLNCFASPDRLPKKLYLFSCDENVCSVLSVAISREEERGQREVAGTQSLVLETPWQAAGFFKTAETATPAGCCRIS